MCSSPPSSLLLHTCACLYSIHSDPSSQSGKLISELRFLPGSSQVGKVCHVVCSQKHYILLALRSGRAWSRVEESPQGRVASLPWSCLAWFNGRTGTEPCQELSPWVPALTPGRPGSVSDMCVGQDMCPVFKDFGSNCSCQGGSLVFLPTSSLKRAHLWPPRDSLPLFPKSAIQCIYLPRQVGTLRDCEIAACVLLWGLSPEEFYRVNCTLFLREVCKIF